MSLCIPSVYVDGIRVLYRPVGPEARPGVSLSALAPLATIEAVEVWSP